MKPHKNYVTQIPGTHRIGKRVTLVWMLTLEKSERSSLYFFNGGPSSLNRFMAAVFRERSCVSVYSRLIEPIRRVSWDNRKRLSLVHRFECNELIVSVLCVIHELMFVSNRHTLVSAGRDTFSYRKGGEGKVEEHLGKLGPKY